MKKLIAMILMAGFTLVAAAQTYTDIKVSELPKATRDYVSQNMPDATITRAVKYDNNGTVNYGVVFESRGNKRVLVFDQNGNFLQKGDHLRLDQKGTAPTQAPAGTKTTTEPKTGPGQEKKEGSNNSKVIDPSLLPAAAQKYIKDAFPNGTITTARHFTQKNVQFYQVKVADGTREHVVSFNSKGSYISKRSSVTPAGTKSNTYNQEKEKDNSKGKATPPSSTQQTRGTGTQTTPSSTTEKKPAPSTGGDQATPEKNKQTPASDKSKQNEKKDNPSTGKAPAKDEVTPGKK